MSGLGNAPLRGHVALAGLLQLADGARWVVRICVTVGGASFRSAASGPGAQGGRGGVQQIPARPQLIKLADHFAHPLLVLIYGFALHPECTTSKMGC